MANALFDLTVDYTYGPERVRDFINLQLEKRVKENLIEESELDSIGLAMEIMACEFIDYNDTIDTLRLRHGVTYKVKKNQIRLFVPSSVKDERGRYYAGHIEFGFSNWKNNMFVGPFPYLRPAMRYGADLSREDISDNLAKIITGERYWWRGSRKDNRYMAGQMIGNKYGALFGAKKVMDKPLAEKGELRHQWGGRSGPYSYARTMHGRWRTTPKRG